MNIKIGVLGFGVVGKSAVNFLQNLKKQNMDFASTRQMISQISVWDQNRLDSELIDELSKIDVTFFSSTDISLEDFIEKPKASRNPLTSVIEIPHPLKRVSFS